MAGNQAAASESSYEIEIPDELGLGDDMDFDAIEIADSDVENGTTDEESPDGDGAPQPEDDKSEGFLTDAELGKMGVTRDSPEHKALEAKFFPLWQDRLRRAGLTEAEIAEKQAGKQPTAEDAPPQVQQTQNTNDESWVTWDDFKDPADLSTIADESDAAVIRQSIREHVSHAVKSVMATSARKQQEFEAANVVKTWAESVKDNPALTPETLKAMQEFVAKPYAEQMWRDDPKGFTTVLAARFGLTPKAAAETPTPAPATPARRTPAPNATVTRARSAPTESRPVQTGGSYEDIVKRTLGETFG